MLWKVLWSYISEYKWKYTIIVLLGAISLILSRYVGNYVSITMKAYFQNTLIDLTFYWFMIYGICFIFDIIFKFTAKFLTNFTSPKSLNKIRLHLVEYLGSLKNTPSYVRESANLIIVYFEYILDQAVLSFLPGVLYALFNIIAFFRMTILLGLYELLIFTFFILISYYFFTISNSDDNLAKKHQSIISAVEQDLFANRELLAIYSRKNFAIKKITPYIHNLENMQIRFNTKANWGQSIILIYLLIFKILIPTAYSLFYWPQHFLLLFSLNTWAFFLMFYSIFQQLHLVQLFFSIISLCDELSKLPKQTDGHINNTIINNSIEIKNLNVSFLNKFILKDFNLSIKSGEILYIIGESGCGKSTLMRCLTGIIDCDGIYIDNICLNHYNKKELSKSLAYVTQASDVLNLTIRENIIFDDEINNNMYEACKLACIIDVIENLPLKYESPIEDLSGGQKQRISIARAIYQILQNKNRIKFLFVDEPISALDPITAKLVMTNLLELSRNLNLTFICIDHTLKFIKEENTVIWFIPQKNSYDIVIDNYSNIKKQQETQMDLFLNKK